MDFLRIGFFCGVTQSRKSFFPPLSNFFIAQVRLLQLIPVVTVSDVPSQNVVQAARHRVIQKICIFDDNKVSNGGHVF